MSFHHGVAIGPPELSLPNPVQMITVETIEQSGKTDLIQFLAGTLALQGSLTKHPDRG